MNRASWAGAALVALTACSEGYQGDGPPLRLHYDMTQRDALEAMSRVVTSAGGGTTAFVLREPCALEWRVGKRVLSSPLLGTEAVLNKKGDTVRYQVSLTMAAGAEDALGATVLENAAWAEATQMKWLLDYVRRFC
jgi:hypothetical protein